MIARTIEKTIVSKLFQGKTILLLGARQVGKSTLLNAIEKTIDKKVLNLNCDNNDIKKQLTDPGINSLKRMFANYDVVLIDEAQRVFNIGLTLKIIHDQLPDIQLIATGSSSLDLSNQINEPLTGRKYEYLLFPLTINELVKHYGFIDVNRNLEQYLVFGMYPDVVTNPGNEPEILSNLVSSYLFKDIFNYQDLRKPELLEKILEALAHQVGSEVSFNELAQLTGTDPHTVQRYVGLLEKAFIIFRLRSFSRNLRNELKKSRKIFFYDNGVRNAILGNFSPIASRSDAGELWENFFVAERTKFIRYHMNFSRQYFWRTRQQQEVDYLEELNGQITAFEMKWNTKKKATVPLTFKNAYPGATSHIIHPENFWDFVE